MQRFVVTYDISSTSKRSKISDILQAYGERVNYSVFEISVKHNTQKRVLENALLEILNPKSDSLRFYSMCENCIGKSWSVGEEPPPFEQSAMHIV